MILLSALGIAVIGMVLYNSKDAIFGVPLTIATTSDGSTVDNRFLPITGIAKHARALLINGREVAFDRQGKFDDGVLLSPGYNIIEVAVKDQFGKSKTKTYHVVLNIPPAVATVSGTPYQ